MFHSYWSGRKRISSVVAEAASARAREGKHADTHASSRTFRADAGRCVNVVGDTTRTERVGPINTFDSTRFLVTVHTGVRCPAIVQVQSSVRRNSVASARDVCCVCTQNSFGYRTALPLDAASPRRVAYLRYSSGGQTESNQQTLAFALSLLNREA